MRFDLQEGSRIESIALPYTVAAAIAQLNVATVTPASTPGTFDISNIRKVGVFVADGWTIRVQPKTTISRIFAMLSFARDPETLWRSDRVPLDADSDLYSAIAFSFAAALERGFSSGVLKGYLVVDEALPMVRGRWRLTDQLTRRAGQPLPLEITYDDFVEDIPLNKVLKSAVLRVLRFPALPAEARFRLRRSLQLLSEVTPLAPGAPTPLIPPSRTNTRYLPALELARLILSNLSLEHRVGSVIGSGFLVDLWSVFEDFVSAAIASSPGASGVTARKQHPSQLDVGGRVRIAPDLVWMMGGEVIACADVKYKIEHFGRYPNADVYQMLSYCTRFGLTEGHLIYAAGEVEPERIEIIGGPSIYRHALRLDASFDELLLQVAELGAVIRSGSSEIAIDVRNERFVGAS